MDWRIRAQRRRSYNEPGHAHELTFSCFNRYRFLGSDRTCEWLAEAISAARFDFHFELWAYVFMPEHVHLVVYPRKVAYEVGEILKAIKEPVGRKAIAYLKRQNSAWLDRITVRHGGRNERRFWEPGGGYDRNVTDPKTLLAMIEYIHLNPVRRGLVDRPEDWKWSSTGWFAGKNSLRPDPINVKLLGL